jgi:signal transduction histidine kinase
LDEFVEELKEQLITIVERDKVQQELQEALLKVNETQKKLIQSEKMAALGMLSAGIAHEINNPINFINAGVAGIELDISDLMRLLELYDSFDIHKLMPEEGNQIDALKEEMDYSYIKDNIMITVNDIKTGATRTEDIIKGLKRFSRGDSETKFEVNVNEEIASNLKIIQRITKKKILFIIDLQEDIQLFDGFPGQLNQLFMNLIVNAEQSIQSDGVIKVATFNNDDGVSILISDNGCGIPKELGDRIFDPFLTTKKVGEGTGLGLSISFGIVENHKGTISYSSEVGVGTVFSVHLPYN